MKGTILDFLILAAEKPELAKELAALATKYGFQFSGELSDNELEEVSGGTDLSTIKQEALEEMYATEQEKEEQRVASTQQYINNLAAMVREMQKLSATTFDSTRLTP